MQRLENRLNLALRWILAGIMVVVFVGRVRASGAMEEGAGSINEPWGKMTYAVETPHTKWANPIPSKPIRILAIGAMPSMREMVELHQRLQCEIIPVMAHTEGDFLPRDIEMCALSQTERLASIRKQLQEPVDVILIGAQSWNSMPAEVRYEIFRKVHDAGATLIYIWPNGLTHEMDVLMKRPALELDFKQLTGGCLDPEMKPMSPRRYDLQARAFGKGRVLLVSYSKDVPYGWHQRYTPGFGDNPLNEVKVDEVRYDYKQAFLARLVLWGANRLDPNQRIQIRQTEKGFRIQSTSQGKTNKIKARLRNNRGEDIQNWKSDKDVYEIILPAGLPADHYILDAWLTDDRERTLDFASLPTEVKSDLSEGKLTFGVVSGKPGAGFQARLELPQTPAGKANVEWVLQDAFDRTLDRVQMETTGKTVETELRLPQEMLSEIVRCEAFISASNTPKTRLVNYLPVKRQWPADEFYFMSGFPHDGPGITFLTFSTLRNLKRLGYDAFMGPWPLEKARWITAAGLKIWNFNAWPLYNVEIQGNVRNPCMHDPAYHERLKKYIREYWEPQSPYATIYNFGDELILGKEVCLCKHTQAAFQNAMRQKYGTIEKANQVWKTDFKSWENVKGELLSEARKRQAYGLHLDFRRFMARSFADLMLSVSDYVHEFDSEALTGWEGIFGALEDRAYDFACLGPKLNYWGPYTFVNSRDPKELVRSFSAKTALRGSWQGDYSRNYYSPSYSNIETAVLFDRVERFEPWNNLLHQFNYTMWFAGRHPYPLFEPMPYFRAAMEEIAEIKAGIARLILNTDRQNEGVAVCYDVLGPYLAQAHNGTRYTTVLSGMLTVLENCHMQYDVIAPADLEDGGKLKDRFRLLVLPGNAALSAGQADGIIQFVKKGGKLLADEMPAILDEYGNKRPESPLAPVFAADSGKIVKGDWDTESGAYSQVAPHRKYIEETANALAELGIKPSVQMTPNIPEVEIARFMSGKDEYVTLLPDLNVEKQVSLKLPVKACVYDVRAGKYLGETDEISVNLKPGRAEIYALLAGRVKGIKASCKAAPTRQGWEVALDARLKGDIGGVHVMRVTVKDPAGKEKAELARNLKLENGSVQAQIFLPQSEKPGDWKLELKDVASGTTKTISMEAPAR